MTGVAEAIRWQGAGRPAMVSVFVVTRAAAAPRFGFPVGPDGPPGVSVLVLEDDLRVLPGALVVEYDLTLDTLPGDLAGYLARCLRAVSADGTVVAWCGFEGTFDFTNLLTDAMVPYVYGLVSASGDPVVAMTDAERRSTAWRDHVRRHRRVLDAAAGRRGDR